MEEKWSHSFQQLNKIPRNEIAKKQTFNKIKYATVKKSFFSPITIMTAVVTMAVSIFIILNLAPVEDLSAGQASNLPIEQIGIQMMQQDVAQILGEPTTVITAIHQDIWRYEDQVLAMYTVNDYYPSKQAVDNLVNGRANAYTYLYWSKTGELTELTHLTYDSFTRLIHQYSLKDDGEVMSLQYAPANFVEKTQTTNLEKLMDTIYLSTSIEQTIRSIGEPLHMLQSADGKSTYTYQFGAPLTLSFKQASEEEQLQMLANQDIQAYVEVQADAMGTIKQNEVYYLEKSSGNIYHYVVFPNNRVTKTIMN